MKLLLKVLLPIAVVAACVIAAKAVVANRPEPTTRPQFKSTTSIDATRVLKSDYPVTLHTQGTVSAIRQGSLVPQVAGAITSVSPNFVAGGEFKAGEVLLEIDPRDFEIAVTLAEATFAQAKAALAEETARSDQASKDWKRLGRSGKPSALTLRQPQLSAARASLAGAKAQVERARLDLSRTKITASYDGRIASKHADLGQYVNKGTALADIYSTEGAEIRLPLNNQQLGFIDLESGKPTVALFADIGGKSQKWQAQITRSDGAIDPDSRQLYVIATITNDTSNSIPLRIGQFVRAEVAGNTLNDVFVLPRSAIREDREVLFVDQLNTLQSRDVEIVWKDAEVAVVTGGLSAGDVISLTALGAVTNGTRVRATIDGEAPATEKPARGNFGGGGQGQGQGQGNNAGRGGNGDQSERMKKLKARVDAGETLPDALVTRFRERIEAGQPVPKWMREYIAKTQ